MNEVNAKRILKDLMYDINQADVFNPSIVIDDHGYDDNHINVIIDLTDKGRGVRQSFL